MSQRCDTPGMPAEERLGLQSMPDDLMALAKDQFGAHYIQFEVWVGQVIDKAFDIGKASVTRMTVVEFCGKTAAAPCAIAEECQYGKAPRSEKRVPLGDTATAIYASPQATSSAIAPNGWKLVPLVPTDEMEKAAYQEDIAYSNNRYTFPSQSRFYNVYCAMLRTAPEAK